MSRGVGTALRVVLAGLAATVCRIIGQLAIPAGAQSVLAPSVFAQNGTMPLAFTVYGLCAYSLIAALFLLVRARMGGRRATRGVRYGLACCVIWIAYLLEPLPHVAPLDRVTYPLADGLALLAMGLTLSALPENRAPLPARERAPGDVWAALTIAGCFFAGRLLQYRALGIYSLYAAARAETLAWAALTGLSTGGTAVYLWRHIAPHGRIASALIVGGLLFGLDLALFNFFMPLVFDADIPDLIARTGIDIAAVTLGCLALPGARVQPHGAREPG